MRTYIQITGGRGPIECARAVALVAKELTNQFPKLELVDYESHNKVDGCFMSMTFATTSELSADVMAEWEGTVLWVATKNPYRPNHKRKNWFVGVHFFFETELVNIDESEIKYEMSRSSGAGGQNVNKVETAVRAIHVPTGIAVRCEDERSQTQNKARAKERLLLKILEINETRKAENEKVVWNNHNNLERGNPIKTFRGSL